MLPSMAAQAGVAEGLERARPADYPYQQAHLQHLLPRLPNTNLS